MSTSFDFLSLLLVQSVVLRGLHFFLQPAYFDKYGPSIPYPL